MKIFLFLTLGLHLILGNVCLMEVAFAAEPSRSMEAHAQHFSEHSHGSCADGQCLYQRGVEPSNTVPTASVLDATGFVSAFSTPFLYQILLLHGPTDSPLSLHGPPPSPPLSSVVVLRE